VSRARAILGADSRERNGDRLMPLRLGRDAWPGWSSWRWVGTRPDHGQDPSSIPICACKRPY
jgi:hypothetical protein